MPDEVPGPDVAEATADLAGWSLPTAALAAGAFVAVLVTARALRLAFRSKPALVELVRHVTLPVAVVAAAAVVRARLGTAPLADGTRGAWAQVVTIVLIGAVAWLVTRGLDVLEGALLGRFEAGPEASRRARALQTQVSVMKRVVDVAVVVVAVIVMLRSFDWGREIGTSLLAAGGIVGAIAGVSGRSTIGNVIAGLQIAFAEPVRLNDVVVVEGEWGHIEEVTLTYVVVRVWDQRRLVLPSSYFVEQPFENWTRDSTDILGTVELWVDYTVPVASMRAELEQLVATSGLWDGRMVTFQVTDASAHALQVRALMSAADSGKVWDLRCHVREGLVRWLATHHPYSLPRLRTLPEPRPAEALPADDLQAAAGSAGADDRHLPRDGGTGNRPGPRQAPAAPIATTRSPAVGGPPAGDAGDG